MSERSPDNVVWSGDLLPVHDIQQIALISLHLRVTSSTISSLLTLEPEAATFCIVCRHAS